MVKSAPPKFVVGIDPGLSGAVAYFLVDPVSDQLILRTVKDMPIIASPYTKGNMIDVDVLAHMLTPSCGSDNLTAYIEIVASMPEQGIASAFKFGQVAMAPEAVLAAYGVRRIMLRPPAWKKEMKLLNKKKEVSVALAKALFPSMADVFLKSKDGRAEAVLIGLAGHRLSRR